MENSRKLLVGLDLDRRSPQICTYEKEGADIVVAPMRVGGDADLLREILDQMEAQGRAGFVISPEQAEKNLASEEKMAEIFRRAFHALGMDHPDRQIEGLMVTASVVTKPLVELLRGVFRRLKLDAGRCWIQDHRESFYYHTLYQNHELWNRNVGLFYFRDHEVTFYAMELNHRTRPVTANVREGDTIYLEESPVRDEIFYQMILNSLRQDMYTSIFLLGEEFDKSWAGRSTALLCKGGRKVFVVDNLFARGACYAAREKAGEDQLSDYLYLGEALVKKNIGLNLLVDGQMSFCQLISAGVNWYEAFGSCEILLGNTKELIFRRSEMQGGQKSEYCLPLEGLPDRPEGTTRLRIELAYDSPNSCRVQVEDLGFGELFPSSGKVWQATMEDTEV